MPDLTTPSHVLFESSTTEYLLFQSLKKMGRAMMLNNQEVSYLRAVAAMSHHPGSYTYLCEGRDGWTFLSHQPVGEVLYNFTP